MRERPAFGARQLCAHDDAVVGERVMDHEVARAEKRPDRRHVGGVPADEGQRGLLAVVGGERRLERPMHRPLAGDEPARRRGDPVPVDRLVRGGPDRGMMVEPEIVVRGEIDHPPAVDDGGRAGVAFVQQEIGIPEAHGLGGGAQQALLGAAGKGVELEKARPVVAVRRGRFAGVGGYRRCAEALANQRVRAGAGRRRTEGGDRGPSATT